MSEAPFEFGVGATQGGLWINLQMSSEIHGREDEVAHLARQRLRRTLDDLVFDLDDLFSDLIQDRANIVPVETDFPGFLLQLRGARERRQRQRNTVQRAGLRFCTSPGLCVRRELRSLLIGLDASP